MFADKLIAQMVESKRMGNAIVYQTAVHRFLGFYSIDDLHFKEITYQLLEVFIHLFTIKGAQIIFPKIPKKPRKL